MDRAFEFSRGNEQSEVPASRRLRKNFLTGRAKDFLEQMRAVPPLQLPYRFKI